MTAININIPCHSFIYDESYCGHALMQPSFQCWAKITQPFPSECNERIKTIAYRTFTLIALLFSSILFIPGLICKSINYLLSQSSRDYLNTYIKDNKTIQSEIFTLNELRTFNANPSKTSYNSLSTASKNLIAIRYLTLSKKISHMNDAPKNLTLFEKKYKPNETNDSNFKKGAEEAYILQEKILFGTIFEQALQKSWQLTLLGRATPLHVKKDLIEASKSTNPLHVNTLINFVWKNGIYSSAVPLPSETQVPKPPSIEEWLPSFDDE